jgi:hypothetical protein
MSAGTLTGKPVGLRADTNPSAPRSIQSGRVLLSRVGPASRRCGVCAKQI